jgi:hypothetical protein
VPRVRIGDSVRVANYSSVSCGPNAGRSRRSLLVKALPSAVSILGSVILFFAILIPLSEDPGQTNRLLDGLWILAVGLLVLPLVVLGEWLLSELGVCHPRGIARAFDHAKWMAAGRLVVRGRDFSPVVEVGLTECDTAAISFRADQPNFGRAASLHFLVKSPALAHAPWLCLEGVEMFFIMPAPLLLAHSLPSWHGTRWRYWGSAALRPLLENASLREALAMFDTPPVLFSRPGRVRVVIEVLAGRDGLEVEWVDRMLPALESVVRKWAELVGPGLPPRLRHTKGGG